MESNNLDQQELFPDFEYTGRPYREFTKVAVLMDNWGNKYVVPQEYALGFIRWCQAEKPNEHPSVDFVTRFARWVVNETYNEVDLYIRTEDIKPAYKFKKIL